MNNIDLEFLKKFIEIKSVSTDRAYAGSLEESKILLQNYITDLGFKIENLGENKTIIYAKRLVSKQAKTLMIYGHYDVQPANESDWKSDPFKLVIKKNKIFARGISDDKGQLFIIVSAIKELIENNSLNNLNLILLIEGEEEISSPTLQDVLNSKIIKDKIDHIFIADSYMIAPNVPTIVSSFRGNIAFEIEIQTLKNEVHSGIFGGAIENAAKSLIEIHTKIFEDKFLKLLNKNNKLIRDKLLLNSSKQADILNFKKEVKNHSITSFVQESPSKMATLNPSLEITGMASGYNGDGIKNIIPASSIIKYNYRFVAGQNGKILTKQIETRFNKLINKTKLKAKIKFHRVSEPAVIDLKSKYINTAYEIAKKIYKSEPIYKAEGGSISIVNLFQKYISSDILLFGFSDLDSNIHGPNENLRIKNLEKGSSFMKNLLKNLSHKATN